MRRGVALGLALVMVASACSRGSRDPSVLQVTEVSGAVLARAADAEAFEAVAKDDKLAPGTAVRVRNGGRITIARGEQSSIELRAPEDLAELVVGATAGDITLRDGDALVKSDPSAPITITSQETIARSADPATFRFDRRLKIRVGVYAGSVDLTVESGPLERLPAFDEYIVNPRIPPVRQPYSLDVADEWDIRLLSEAVAIEQALQPLATGYEAQFGRKMKDVERLSVVKTDAGRKSIGYVVSSLPLVSSSDVVIGLVYSLLIERAATDQAPRSYISMIKRRREGAAWGLIAHERGLDSKTVLSTMTCVIALLTGEAKAGERCFAAEPPPPPPSAPPRSSDPQPSRPPTSSPEPTPTVSPTRTKPPGPSPSPSTSISPSPSPSCSDIDKLLGNC